MAFNVANDPFLTHALPAVRPPQEQPAPQAATAYQDPFALHGQRREDPFLAHTDRPGPGQGTQQDFPRNLFNVGANPFMVGLPTTADAAWPPEAGAEVPGTGRLPANTQELRELTLDHWTACIYRGLGPGDPDRDPRSHQLLILWPWLLFLWVLALWLFLRHFSKVACVAMTAVLGTGAVLMVVAWLVGHQGKAVPLLPLGLLCLLAVGMGTWAGLFSWSRFFRQVWWLHTGPQYDGTLASTPGLARGDAAILSFLDTRTNATLDGALVDDSRSAGFKEAHTYCVAPILSPATAGADIVLVNYWAVGIDCCETLSAFACDSSRDWQGGYGVVMLDHGFPCPGCNSEKFAAAVRKAETMHGLVSAPGALYVRWVEDPAAIGSEVFWRGVLFVLIAVIVSPVVLFLPAHLAWYYGVGRSVPWSDDAGTRHKV